MSRGKAAPRKRAGLRKLTLIPADMMPLLRSAGFIASDVDADVVWGYFDRSGQPRRILAKFPNNVRADLRINCDGSFSLSQSISAHFKTAEKVDA